MEFTLTQTEKEAILKQRSEALTVEQQQAQKQVQQAIDSANESVIQAKKKELRRQSFVDSIKKLENWETVFEIETNTVNVGPGYYYEEMVKEGFSIEDLNKVNDYFEDVPSTTISVKYSEWLSYNRELRETTSSLDFDGDKVRCWGLTSSERKYSIAGIMKKAINVTKEAIESSESNDRELASYRKAKLEVEVKYPNAKVGLIRTSAGSRGNYRDVRRITVDFKNGSKLELSVWNDKLTVQKKIDAAVNEYTANDWLNKFNNDNK